MGFTKITELNQILSGEVSSNDVLPIVDITTDETKKIEISQLQSYILSGLDSSNISEVTYSELYNKITNGLLNPGRWYRLTDYKSVNFLNGWEIANNNPTPSDPNFNPREIYTGETEVLLLQAVSEYEISQIGYSETFNGDIIQYQAFTNKIGVDLNIANGYTLPDSTIVGGFDLQWDGTNVYFNMPTNYPALFGHYFYLYCEFDDEQNYGGFVNGTFSGLSVSDDMSYIVSPTGGSGVNLSIYVANLISTPGEYTLYGIINPGTGYVVGDILSVPGSQIGGVDGINDLTITITSINPQIISYYQDGNFEPLIPGISTCQYPYTSDNPDYNYPKKMTRLSVSADGMKVVLLDLTETDYNNYVADTLYVETIYAIGDAYGWITKRQDTLRNITAPLDFRGRKYRRFEVDLSSVNAALGIGYYGQGDNYLSQGTTGNYKDFKVFGEDGYDTYNIEWNDMGGADMYWYCGYNDNVVFQGICYDNKIGSICRNNTIGDSFYQNTIGNGFYQNTIGNGFYQNTIGNSFYQNTIGNGFYQNTIGNSFINNTIGINFYYNTIGYNFQWNIIKYSINFTDFTFATHVYGYYNCEIFGRSDGALRLSYVDASNTVQYSPITA